jgi:HEPN domain-containing protein
MPDNARMLVDEWFAKAEDDVLSVRAILKEGGAPSTACFLSQQIAEKYLKGILVFLKTTFPKVHDLLDLETLIHKSMPDVTALHDDLATLNRYYIETRYPGGFPAFHIDEARAAFEAALRIKIFVLLKVGQ